MQRGRQVFEQKGDCLVDLGRVDGMIVIEDEDGRAGEPGRSLISDVIIGSKAGRRAVCSRVKAVLPTLASSRWQAVVR